MLEINNLEYKGPLRFDLFGLCFKGVVKKLFLEVKNRRGTIKIGAPTLKLEVKKGEINLSSQRLYLGNSIFSINGYYKKEKVFFKGSGEFLQNDLKELFKFWGLSLPDIRTSVKVISFQLEKEGNKIFYEGSHRLKNLNFSFSLKNSPESLEIIGRILGNQTDFNWSFEKNVVYKLKSRGILDLKEFNFLFHGIKLSGKVISDLDFSFESPVYKIKKLIGNYISG